MVFYPKSRNLSGYLSFHRGLAVNNYPRFDLSGQVALVTGAARGIGRTIACALANAGADVALGLRDINTSSELVAEIEAMGRRCLPLQLDVTNLEQIDAAIDRVVSHFGKLDILVNNAGLGPENRAEDVTEADFDLTVDVNLKGTFFVSQAAGKVMIQQKYGRIINLSSQAAFVALEWGIHNITVNAVAPTFISTPGTDQALSDPEFYADTIERIAALHRVGDPMDVAGPVIFLASPAASLITGDTILIDGGWTAR
jgi:NAD(P)-dependent dehydrogenase (short-subunit alcohol dehydrogenase family)